MESNINNEGENKKEEIKKKEDTHSYRGWMNSDSFLKRIVGVFFYALAGFIVVEIIIGIVAFFIGFVLGFMGVL